MFRLRAIMPRGILLSGGCTMSVLSCPIVWGYPVLHKGMHPGCIVLCLH